MSKPSGLSMGVFDGPRSKTQRICNPLSHAGVPRSQAMKTMGHKTESLYRRYVIVRPEDVADGTQKLSAYRQSRQARQRN
ncbi:MAG: hypothetical protein ACRD3O_03490 [Terriglobia bacterium]